MTVSTTHAARQSLRLLISPPSLLYRNVTAGGSSPSPSSSFPRKEVSYESPSGEAYERICSVMCLYDFTSSDPDHLPFSKNDILEIVKQEDSGWWAAVRGDGSEVGWIPASYVRALSDDAADKLRNLRDETQIPEFVLDKGSKSAPASLKRLVDSPLSSGTNYSDDDAALDTNRLSVFSFLTIAQSPNPEVAKDGGRNRRPPVLLTDIDVQDSPILAKSPYVSQPNQPTSLLSAHPDGKPLLRLDKSLPASPAPTVAVPTAEEADTKFGAHNRSLSNGAISPTDRSLRRRPVLLDDHSSLQRLSSLIQTHNLDQLRSLASPSTGSPLVDSPAPRTPISPLNPTPRSQASRLGKIKQLTGDDDAQAFHNAKLAQANLPWYLRPKYGDDEIKLDYDGTVKAGTLPALVERLVIDPLRMSQQETFRRAFLVTFRTFASATEVFDLLVGHYEMDSPPGLSEAEFEQWKREKLRPTQKRVLTVLTMWLEDHDLLNQEPEIAPRLQEFLSLIVSPAAMTLTAKHMLISLERLTFAEPQQPDANSINGRSASKRWKKIRKSLAYDLMHMDPLDLAQHLCLYEHNLYMKVRSQECFAWTKVREGAVVRNIAAFCSTHEKLADWVKYSVLQVDGLGKRAHAVDFWIRVAEKCRSLNNFSSLSSIVAALSSTVISRLHFTWLNSGRESALEPLLKFNAPAGNYSYYRGVLDTVEGPCVPYVGPFLKSIVYAQDQHADNVVVTSMTAPEKQYTLIHFVKRQKWYEVTSTMLRFQSKPYGFAEIPGITNFIQTQMNKAAGRDERWFWTRSDELQQAELVHADIRKGLEAAGF
ncbi:ras GEF [Artomyces pyxidatus]|uniref:Ras GEF n=1 Tax=Artomyces pyxidatus TaxID=48021 RepID=A0ACB8THU5_9AGAM|nr:ras GEF [Artomyces pyxidatus]